LIVNGKTSQGVMNDLVKKFYQKVKKYTQNALCVEDFAHFKKVNGLRMTQLIKW
jgi:DNA-directed RNA polymerase subunit beta